MKRQLIRSATFIRAAKKAVKKRPQITEDIRTSLELLVDDPLEICRMINEFHLDLLSGIKWIKELNAGEIKDKVNVLHDDIFHGNSNSLFVGRFN